MTQLKWLPIKKTQNKILNLQEILEDSKKGLIYVYLQYEYKKYSSFLLSFNDNNFYDILLRSEFYMIV